MSNNFKSLIERKLVPVGKSGNDIIYICPKCDDKSGHLWVNYNTNKFHCFRCDWGSKSLIPLVKELGMDISFNYDIFDMDYSKGLEDILNMKDTLGKKRVVDYSRNLKTLTQYYEYHTKELSSVATEYLLGRGLSMDLINRLNIREGLNRYGETLDINGKKFIGRDYSERIMVPSTQRGGTIISFFVARDYTGRKKNKYVNPPKELAFSSEDVFNLSNVDSEHVVICEGVFTAISVISALGKNMAVATYGKSIASKSNSDNPTITVTSQGEKLLNRKFKTYYVFYDLDARSSALNTCKYLSDRGANVKLVTINTDKYGEKADANDLTKEEILECIVNAKTYTRFTSLEDLF